MASELGTTFFPQNGLRRGLVIMTVQGWNSRRYCVKWRGKIAKHKLAFYDLKIKWLCLSIFLVELFQMKKFN